MSKESKKQSKKTNLIKPSDKFPKVLNAVQKSVPKEVPFLSWVLGGNFIPTPIKLSPPPPPSSSSSPLSALFDFPQVSAKKREDNKCSFRRRLSFGKGGGGG